MSHLRVRNASSSAAAILHKKKVNYGTKLNQSARYRPETTNISSLTDIPKHKIRPKTSD